MINLVSNAVFLHEVTPNRSCLIALIAGQANDNAISWFIANEGMILKKSSMNEKSLNL